MRKAFARCSASLPRALATPSSNLFANRALRFGRVVRTSQPAFSAIRSIHASPFLRQTAVAAEEEENINGGQELITRFQDLEKLQIIHPNVINSITRGMGLETMTEVQSKTINEAIKGTDMIAQARTGTGKTIAFLLPVLQNLSLIHI